MKTNRTDLPPMWVKIFSGVFLIFLCSPALAVWQVTETGCEHTITALGLKLERGKGPLIRMLALDATLFIGALTGLFILTRRAFAYGFGIFYCISAIAVSVSAHLAPGTRDEIDWQNFAIQYPLLICFFIHLLRHRDQWRMKYTHKARLEQLPGVTAMP